MPGEAQPNDAARDIAAAVLAARVAARIGRAGAAFPPVAISGFTVVRGGSVPGRLAAWLRGEERATLAALLHLDRVAARGRQAGDAMAELQERSPTLLIRLLEQWPTLTAPMAEALASASQAAVQRNLRLIEARGLIRELTGQGRYRVWAARI